LDQEENNLNSIKKGKCFLLGEQQYEIAAIIFYSQWSHRGITYWKATP